LPVLLKMPYGESRMPTRSAPMVPIVARATSSAKRLRASALPP